MQQSLLDQMEKEHNRLRSEYPTISALNNEERNTQNQEQHTKLGYLHLRVGICTFKALIDTGASACVISVNQVKAIKRENPEAIQEGNQPNTGEQIRLANGELTPIINTVQITFTLFDRKYTATFLVLAQTNSIILGWPFFAENDLTIDCKRRILTTEGATLQINNLEAQREKQWSNTYPVEIHNTITIPPDRQEIIYCKLCNLENPQHFAEITGIITPIPPSSDQKAEITYAIAHTITTLDKEGGCHVILTNISDEIRTFPKETQIAQFTIMTQDEYDDTREIHPIAAELLLQKPQSITYTRKEFHEIIKLSTPTKHTCAALEDLSENIKKIQDEYNIKPTPTDNIHDIVQYKPLEGATNEIWFATPENTQDPSTLDEFNKRVYNLILDCREKEKLDPTKGTRERERNF